MKVLAKESHDQQFPSSQISLIAEDKDGQELLKKWQQNQINLQNPSIISIVAQSTKIDPQSIHRQFPIFESHKLEFSIFYFCYLNNTFFSKMSKNNQHSFDKKIVQFLASLSPASQPEGQSEVQIVNYFHSYQKQFINCDQSMYWNYIVPQTFFYTTFLHQLPDTNTSIPQFEYETKQICSSSIRKSNISNNFLNISEQDLLKAGYESCKTPWTQEEDQKLRFLRDQQEMEWSELAKLIPGRNSKMCYSRYRRLESSTKDPWKKKQNDLLIELVGLLGTDWKNIGKFFENRTHKQVKEHYVNYLRPEINRDDWTLQEDIKLVNSLNEFGKNWKAIEERLLGRTQNQIKNRYFGRLKRLAEKKNGVKEKI